jgi:hypothetical protein
MDPANCAIRSPCSNASIADSASDADAYRSRASLAINRSTISSKERGTCVLSVEIGVASSFNC